MCPLTEIRAKLAMAFADPLLRLPVRGIQKDVENPWGFTRSQNNRG